jgi:uncharacterized Ntn-hydrolase superfamily protein
VQTNNLAVGASVPYAQAGVGAVVSQFETNPHYGPRGLALLAQGVSPEGALEKLLAEDGNFDGEGPEARQVALVSIDGRTAAYTGDEARRAVWAGVRSGPSFTIQGNGLVSVAVVDAMEQAFRGAQGTLAERLMASLVAGDLAGGQRTGRESAALLVRTPDGWPIDIDLRVDHSNNPVADLKTLADMLLARQQVIQANILARKGQLEPARSLLIAAVGRASNWPRIWIRAARVAEAIGDPLLAVQYLTVAFSQNPLWMQMEIGNGNYAELGASSQFQKWVSPEQRQNAIAEYNHWSQAKEHSAESRMQMSRTWLEIGRSDDALVILNKESQPADASVDFLFLRSIAYEAKGDYTAAIKQCQAASAKGPDQPRIRRRIERLEQEKMSRQP